MIKFIKPITFLLITFLFACCSSPNHQIVGKWVNSKDKSVYFEFSENGSFDIKNSSTDKSTLNSEYKYSTYEQNGTKKIKYTQLKNGEIVDTRHEVYKIENDVLKFEMKAYSHRGSKSWFQNYYRKK